MVKALNYKSSPKQIDRKRFTGFKETQKCSNCSFYQKLNDGWGDCQLIKSGVVATDGWCQSWAQKRA